MTSSLAANDRFLVNPNIRWRGHVWRLRVESDPWHRETRRFEDGFPMNLACSRYHQGF